MNKLATSAPIALIVENDDLVAQAVECVVEAMGLNVLGPVATVREGETLLEQCRPDVALLDYALEGGTTEPLLRRLVAEHIPVLVLTGHSAAELPTAFGQATYLSKPYTLGDLRACLKGVGIATD